SSDVCSSDIAELAKGAGYSVGAFYARFRSKDEFFEALVAQHLEIRTVTQVQLLANLPRATLLRELVINIVNYYWDHRKFWRAVLLRSARDPESYTPMRQHRLEATERFAQRVEQEVGRPLTGTERSNIGFAFQVVL